MRSKLFNRKIWTTGRLALCYIGLLLLVSVCFYGSGSLIGVVLAIVLTLLVAKYVVKYIGELYET